MLHEAKPSAIYPMCHEGDSGTILLYHEVNWDPQIYTMPDVQLKHISPSFKYLNSNVIVMNNL